MKRREAANRDEEWCRTIVNTLNSKEVEKIMVYLNKHYPLSTFDERWIMDQPAELHDALTRWREGR